MNLIIHTDGGARGNPGPAAIGVVIEKAEGSETPACRQAGKAELITEFGETIGVATNNVAEYKAVLAALKYLKENKNYISQGNCRIEFMLDSILVVNQLSGIFKIKDANLRQIFTDIRILESEIGCSASYCHIPRTQNLLADRLVNQALDREMYSA